MDKDIKKFELYHCRRKGFWGDQVFPVDFEHVATITCPSITNVVRLTCHLSHDWTRNMGVLSHVDKARSTAVGDIIKTESGEQFRVKLMDLEAIV